MASPADRGGDISPDAVKDVQVSENRDNIASIHLSASVCTGGGSVTLKRRPGRPRKQNNLNKTPDIQGHIVSSSSDNTVHKNTEKESEAYHVTLKQKEMLPERSTHKRKSSISNDILVHSAKEHKSGDADVGKIITENAGITKTRITLEITETTSEKQDTNTLPEVEITELVDDEGSTIEAIYKWSQNNQSTASDDTTTALKMSNVMNPECAGKRAVGTQKMLTLDSVELSLHEKSKRSKGEYDKSGSSESNKIIEKTEKKKRGRPKKCVAGPQTESYPATSSRHETYQENLKCSGSSMSNAGRSSKDASFPSASTVTSTRSYTKGKRRIGKPPVLGKFDCKHCDYVATEKNLLTKHMVIHRKPTLQCKFCEFSTTSLNLYLQHDTSHTKIKHFKCDICGFASRVRLDLMRHMIRHSDEKNFKCPHCDFTTKWRTNIRHHILKHTSDRPYKCTICPMAFKRIQDLQYHLYRHSDVKPLKCDKCEFRCKTNYELKFHQHKHSNVRSFKCTHPTCNFASKTRSDLTKHAKVHSNARNFKCPLCSRAFKSASSRNKHIKRHSDERPYMCEICKKKFKTKPCVYKHMHLHMDIRPFLCDICQKRFSNKSNMIKHKETHNMQNRPFPCPICPYWGTNKQNLLAHIGTMHSNSFAYFCELCKKPFRRYAALKVHYNRMHTKEELQHIPSVFDLKPCKNRNIKLEEGEETQKSISERDFQVKGMVSNVKIEAADLADDGQSEVGESSDFALNVVNANESLKMGLNANLSLSGSKIAGKNLRNRKSSNCVTSASQGSAGTASSSDLSKHKDEQITDLEGKNTDSCPSDVLSESSNVRSRSSEVLSSCSATLAMYDDFRLPLATKGFKFNLDKNGIKPKSWFMNPTNIQQPKEQLRQLEYMWKKHQFDKGLSRKPSTYKRYSRARKIAYLQEQLKGVDDYSPDAKPLSHSNLYRKSYLKGPSEIPSCILENTNLNQKPKLVTVPAKVSEEASKNIKKIPLHDRLLTIGKTEPSVGVETDQESMTTNNGEVQSESAGPSAVNSKGQFIKYYFKGKAILSEVKTENSKSEKDSGNAVLKNSSGIDVPSSSNVSDPNSQDRVLHTEVSEENPSDAGKELHRNLIKLEPDKGESSGLAKNFGSLAEAVVNKKSDTSRNTSTNNVIHDQKAINEGTKDNSTLQPSAPLNPADDDKLKSKQRGRPKKSKRGGSPRKTSTNEQNGESEKVRRPRGRPRLDSVQSNFEDIKTKRKTREPLSDSNLEVLKKLRGRPKAITCHKDMEETVKRPRGRPRSVIKSPEKPVRGRGRPPGSFKYAKMNIFSENKTSEQLSENLAKKNNDMGRDLSPALLKLREKHARLANVSEDRIVMVQPKPDISDKYKCEYVAMKEPDGEKSRILRLLARTKDIVLENALTTYGKTRMKIDKSVTQKYEYVHSSGKVTKVTSKGKVVPMTNSLVNDKEDEVKTLDLNGKLIKQIVLLKKKSRGAKPGVETCPVENQSRDDLTKHPSGDKSILELGTSNEDPNEESIDDPCMDRCTQNVDMHISDNQSNVTGYLCQTTEPDVTGYSIQRETDPSNQYVTVPVMEMDKNYLMVVPEVNIAQDTNVMDPDTMETKPDVGSLDTSTESPASGRQTFTFVPVAIKQEVDDTADYAFATNQQYSTANGPELQNLDHSASEVQYISNYETDQQEQAPIPEDTEPVPSDVKFYSDDVVSLRKKNDLDGNDIQVSQDPMVNAVINDTEDENIVHVMRLQDIKVEQYLGFDVQSSSTVQSNHESSFSSNQCVSMNTESQDGDGDFECQEHASEETTSASEKVSRLNIASVFYLQNTNVNSEHDFKEESFQGVASDPCSSQQQSGECDDAEIQEKSVNLQDVVVKQEIDLFY